MVDETTTSVPVQPATTESAASVAPTVVENTSSTAPVSAPATTETVAPITTTSETPPVQTKSDTILGTDVTKPQADAAPAKIEEPAKTTEAAKPAEKVDDKSPEKIEGDKSVESNQSTETAPLPTYEWKLSEEQKFDEAKLGDYSKALGQLETAIKTDPAKAHELVQELGQKFLEQHTAETKDTLKRLVDSYSAAWESQTNGWFEAFKNDPEIGDKRFETTKANVLQAVSAHAGNAEQLKEFKTFMNDTGVGNNPALIRFINNMQSTIKGYQQKYESESGKPLSAAKPVPEKKGFLQTMYGNMK